MTPKAKQRGARRGMVLVIVLVVVAALTLAGYTFSNLMLAHNEAARLRGRRVQTRVLLDSAADAIRYLLLQDETAREETGGIYDNPTYFRDVVVADGVEPADRAAFTVLSPLMDETGNVVGVRYGLEDESSRLNLNALLLADKIQPNGGRTLLMALPGMTEETADAILDWIDEDDEPRELGAEIEYYSTLDPPYAPKNGPLDTIDELLLVRGVTPHLLYGLDVNRNGVVDAFEATGQVYGQDELSAEMAAEVQSYGGALDRGWAAYLTLYSKEKNVNPEGLPRIDLNMEDLTQLYTELTTVLEPQWAAFIVAYRQFGPYEGDEGGEPLAEDAQPDLARQGQATISQVLDLVGAKVQGRLAGDREDRVIQSPFTDDPAAMAVYLPLLMDYCTVNPNPVIPGRLNINACSPVLLAGLPGLSEDQVTAILEQRSLQAEDAALLDLMRHETWLLTTGIVPLEQMKTLTPLICAGGDVYRAQLVGYYEDGKAASRAEAVFDATGSTPRVLFWRDMSRLGRGYSLDVLGTQYLEAPYSTAPQALSPAYP